jgi:exosortase
MTALVLPGSRSPVLRPTALLAGLAACCLLWAYWPTLAELGETWSRDPHYSHGFLVPVFAVALLGLRARQLQGNRLRPSLWGIPLLAAGVAVRLTGAYYYYPWLDPASLLASLAGLVLLAGGWPALRWSWPALAFLVFMLPLPYQLKIALAMPLRRAATLASTYVLQTLGLPALAEGNTILIHDVQIGVVEACSGLSMLVVFFALATGLAFVIRRPLWEKGLLVASAVPVALAANIIRITVTALLYDWVGGEEARAFFHDWAGWLMMPLAIALLWGELRLLAWLLSGQPSRRWRRSLAPRFPKRSPGGEGAPLLSGPPAAGRGAAPQGSPACDNHSPLT